MDHTDLDGIFRRRDNHMKNFRDLVVYSRDSSPQVPYS